jgi:hypothetical protein
VILDDIAVPRSVFHEKKLVFFHGTGSVFSICITPALAKTPQRLNVFPLLIGIGGESLAVAQNTYAVSWFKGKELNMVFGFQVNMVDFHNYVGKNLPVFDVLCIDSRVSLPQYQIS